MSFFSSIEQLPNDPILHLNILFTNDPRPSKINLGVGVYNDADGKLSLFDCVHRAEERIYQSKQSKSYLPIDGLPGFNEQTLRLIYGDLNRQDSGLHIYGVQAIGGTGALKIGAKFLVDNCNPNIFIPNPSWLNHHLLFLNSDMNVKEYPYYDSKESKLLFSEMCDCISLMPIGSIILLQACCHNPSGADLSQDQWKEIAKLVKKQHLIPFFDLAYQGFGDSVEDDPFPIRHFFQEGIEHLVAYSFSKNMGLYGERVGLFSIAVNDDKAILPISSQVKQGIVRGIYSSPPRHGGNLANNVLSDVSLRADWQRELFAMCQRIKEIRIEFAKGFKEANSNYDFSYLEGQKGLFSILPLNPDQVMLLRDEFCIYMPVNGRINVAGLNSKNMSYVISSLLAVMKK